MGRRVPTKSFTKFLDATSLDDSFVLGYYGGGNYGDELLFEVLQHVFKQHRYHTVSFLYQKPAINYRTYHEDLGYNPIDASDKKAVLREVLQHKNLVIGGGGLWGLDINLNVLLMSFMLFIARWILRKNVYLIGVGYYNSTSRLGHIAAWFAGKAAMQILARDPESYRRFSRLNRQTYLTDDIAFSLPDIIKMHSSTSTRLETAFKNLGGPIALMSVRRFKPHQANPYVDTLKKWLHEHPEHSVILALMEPREVDPQAYALLKEWQATRSNTEVVDFSYNPLELYDFFMKYKDRLCYIGPQFHVQLVAHLANVRFLPLVYDNKVAELLRTLHYQNPVAIADISTNVIEDFISSEEAR